MSATSDCSSSSQPLPLYSSRHFFSIHIDPFLEIIDFIQKGLLKSTLSSIHGWKEKFFFVSNSSLRMTPEERDRLTKGLKSLKRKSGPTGDLPKKARIGEFSHAVPIQAMPVPKSATIVPSSTPFEEVAPSAPLQLEEATGKRKKRAVGKKVGRRVGSSESGGPDQEQASLDDWEVVQSLMKGSILPHIVAKIPWKGDVERFDESFAAYLELGHYLFFHSEAVGQRWAEASKALEEARAEVEKARAEVESMRMVLEIQSAEVERLQKELRVEREETTNLRTALAQEEEEKRKAQEGVGVAVEQAVESFKSSRDMEDIKIAFAQEAFIKGL
ncbi:hypothetical protein COCNU_10G009040 [Cocos nucifera]|uniref:Uncharacterized protein n=1 Tax=Cocos nucifera TaxID=13894 RepID=A0A8K0IMD5_COCNU|nr:hypothetical protein COCNU_10G009040 [Cocos nucifera]